MMEILAVKPPLKAEQRVARADRFTPLIHNCWYVAAWSHELTDRALSRRILDRNICFYRLTDGNPVALHDRCPHRGMPLSTGYREGDNIRCQYHGLLFGPDGGCLEVPSQDTPPPRKLAVSRYVVVERQPLIWIWTGDPKDANPADIPDHEWLSDPQWEYGAGSMHLKCNYVGLHENLLDLSHFTYLHPGNVGTPEFVKAKMTVEVNGDRVRALRFVPSCDVPTLYAVSTRLQGKRVSRSTVSEFVTPAMHSASAVITVLDPEPESRKFFDTRILHLTTPESQDSTHYFFAHGRNFSVPDAQITEFVRQAAVQAFVEDATALEAIARIQDTEPGYDVPEFHILSDQPGIAMRRAIARLAMLENEEI